MGFECQLFCGITLGVYLSDDDSEFAASYRDSVRKAKDFLLGNLITGNGKKEEVSKVCRVLKERVSSSSSVAKAAMRLAFPHVRTVYARGTRRYYVGASFHSLGHEEVCSQLTLHHLNIYIFRNYSNIAINSLFLYIRLGFQQKMNYCIPSAIILTFCMKIVLYLRVACNIIYNIFVVLVLLLH